MSGNTLLCECEFFVPTAYNDERQVEPETMLRIHAVLIRQFEALTLLPPVKGEWCGQIEKHAWYRIAIPQSRVEELQEVVASIGKELGQKQMYFKAGPPSVRLINIGDDTPRLS